MMNLFSLIADQVRNKQELFEEEGKIMQALLNDGYHLHEADAAITLIQTLAQNQSESFLAPSSAASPALMRVMTREERERFDVDAFGFVSKLTRLGIITADQREDLLEKALTGYAGRIELDHIKSLVTFTLFTGPHDQEHGAPSGFRRIKSTAWN
jgi:Smg protein